jgi:GNAT superfamily N-acetyltransferase
MHDEYRIRPATPQDAAVIARHRGEMFRSMGEFDDAAAREVAAASLPQLDEMMRRGEYRGWLILCNGQTVAGGGMVLRKLLPRPRALQGGTESLIVNFYTEPEHRHRGLARQLMQTMLDWCRQHGVANVVLHASDEGRPLYQSLGFVPTNEMRLQANGRGQ